MLGLGLALPGCASGGRRGGANCPVLYSRPARLPRADRLNPVVIQQPMVDPLAYVAAQSGASHRVWEPNHFEIGVDGFEMVEAEQERADYCWAAAVQMVLAFKTVDIEQETIVDAILGRDRESGSAARLGQIVCALNGWVPNGAGATAVTATPFAATGANVLQELASNRPLVVGMRQRALSVGHVCVLTGASYSHTPYGPCFHDLTVFDPYPNEGESTLEAQEFNNVWDFAIVVWVANA